MGLVVVPAWSRLPKLVLQKPKIYIRAAKHMLILRGSVGAPLPMPRLRFDEGTQLKCAVKHIRLCARIANESLLIQLLSRAHYQI